MRVVAGRFGRTRLETLPGDAVRPTADRVKEALFATLGPRLSGARVVDCFAGTGSLGIEALSRGASRVWFVEQAPGSLRLLSRNLERLGSPPEARMVAASALTPAVWGKEILPVDLILADPPYRLGLGVEFLAGLAGVQALAEGGLLVLEHESGAEPGHPAWTPTQRRRYGDTTVSLFTPTAPGRGAV